MLSSPSNQVAGVADEKPFEPHPVRGPGQRSAVTSVLKRPLYAVNPSLRNSLVAHDASVVQVVPKLIERDAHQLAPGSHFGFGKQLLERPLDRSLGQVQPSGDLLIR
jgi:hypothetical protein